jgi:hypothetical protein
MLARLGKTFVRPRAFAWVAVLITGVSIAASRAPPADPELLRAGELIYRQGLLPSGEPLVAMREGAEPVLGVNGACVNCHRRSGLGSLEERIFIPPITAKYLFRPVTANASEMAQGSGDGSDTSGPIRSPYNEALLARALRDGVDPDGRKFHYLMPRYALDEASMHAMIVYLRQLSRGRARGVGEETLDFATIIAPDADETERAGMLDVLNHCFGASGASNPGQPANSSQLRNRGSRTWHLHVWQLTGPAQGWEQQLRQHLAAEPVFAVVSGLGRKNWEPVHRFCEAQSLPCLLPNVDLPVVAEDDFYPLYYSKGVLLEARLIASRLQDQPSERRVIQIFREDDIGAAAAAALQSAAGGLRTLPRVLKARLAASELARVLKDTRPDDAIVLWLRPEDLKALPATPPATAAVFLSGLMGGLEQTPLPAAWRGAARMSYPFELPTKRAIAMDYARGWFAFKHIPVVAERTQTDTYLACGILSEAAAHMRDNLVPDYLVESIEVEVDHRLVDGYYPRLRLASGQRFASKGGYLVRFDGVNGTRLVADGDWIVP